MTSRDLLRFGIIDEVIPEPLGGAHRDHREAASNLKSFLLRALRELTDVPLDDLLDRRYEKYRKIGVFVESALPLDDREPGAVTSPHPAPDHSPAAGLRVNGQVEPAV